MGKEWLGMTCVSPLPSKLEIYVVCDACLSVLFMKEGDPFGRSLKALF
jgi:hypothetical protein